MKTFNLEDRLRLGAHHLESLVDEQGRTYFNVFLTKPAEAVFDWPDYVDLPARYIEAAAMVEPALGRPVTTVPALRKWLFGFFAPDGLCYRPETLVSSYWAELFDQARLMYMLNSWLMHDPGDDEVRMRLINLCQGIYNKATFENDYAFIEKIGIYFGGTLIRPLVQSGLTLNEPKWIDFAGAMTRGILFHSNHYGEDGSFEGHHHGHLGTISGMVAYAVITGDQRIKDKIRTIYTWSRSISTDFGFVPEVANRKDDLVMCETCTLMDSLDVALLLARHVDPAFWDVIEKSTRNHLVEAQLTDAGWLAVNPAVPDEEDIIRSQIRQRVKGSFAGWASPHAQLGVGEEQQRYNWVKSESLRPRYWGKIRALQNCCAGAGIRALHMAWSNIATFQDDTLTVNMLMDKTIPQATITSFIPYQGRATIRVNRDCKVRFRVSPSVPGHDIRTTCQGKPMATKREGVFLTIEQVKTGDVLEITFPLREKTEPFTVGNNGFQQYNFTAEWKGDTIVGMQADPANPKTGFSAVMKEPVPVWFGPDAPGLMYQRDACRKDHTDMTAAETVMDQGKIDWFSLEQPRS
jgi:hypothetical protein